MAEERRDRDDADQRVVTFTDKTGRIHGIDYSEGDYRALGYGQPEDAEERRVRYDQLASTHDELLKLAKALSRDRNAMPLHSRKAEGPHRGVGPKGYVRPDERIIDDLYVRLVHHPKIDASDIDFEVDRGVVSLSGFVTSKEDKWLAEDIAWSISGVTDVRNRLKRYDPASPYDYGDRS